MLGLRWYSSDTSSLIRYNPFPLNPARRFKTCIFICSEAYTCAIDSKTGSDSSTSGYSGPQMQSVWVISSTLIKPGQPLQITATNGMSEQIRTEASQCTNLNHMQATLSACTGTGTGSQYIWFRPGPPQTYEQAMVRRLEPRGDKQSLTVFYMLSSGSFPRTNLV